MIVTKAKIALAGLALAAVCVMAPQQANAQVIVRGEVFPGTTIVIGDVSMAVPSDMKYCKFVKQQGDVKMVAI